MKRTHVLLVAVLLLGGCDFYDKRDPGPQPEIQSTLRSAAQKTLGAGPSRVTATISASYRLNGRLDVEGGYRLCAVLSNAARDEYLEGHSLWLEGRAYSYGTLTTLSASRHCRRSATWLDDHPPTLDIGADAGGEDYLHATLIALTALASATPSDAQACGSGCVRAVLDFPALDRKPARRDEDRWTLVPLLRSLGRHPITAEIDDDGYLSRIALAETSITLSDYGEAAPVPRVVASAIE